MSDTTETETDTNTDNTDEPSKAELHDRVKQLESTVEKLMPSRRDALRLGAAGLAGAAGLGAASRSAEASTGSAGTIGSSGSRPDLLADDVDTRSVTQRTLYAGAFAGSSVDSRLDSALNAASDGSTIILEPRQVASYTQNRTINTRVCLRGVGSRSDSEFAGNLTFATPVTVKNIALRGNVDIDNQSSVTACDIGAGSHTVTGQDNTIIGCRGFGATIEFTSSSSGCIAIGNIGVSFVNNGSNIQITANA